MEVMNETNQTDAELLEFEVFDSRDMMNVLSYGIMSLSKWPRQLYIFLSNLGNSSIKKIKKLGRFS